MTTSPLPFRSPYPQKRSATKPQDGTRDLGGRTGNRPQMQWRTKCRQRQQQRWRLRQKGGVEGECAVERKGEEEGEEEGRTDIRRGRSSAKHLDGNGGVEHASEAHAGGQDVLTIEKIMHKCGKSLIEPSVVNAPMDFLTTEAEYMRVWQVFKSWLCSAVSAKLRACIPKFFSLSYRVFNLGICIPTLELDSRYLSRYGISQEQSLSSKSMLSPRAPQQVEFSREVLGKGAGLPPARAFYALEVLLCAVGKEAGMGTTLLVDCGVGVLAARGRMMKFTFVQGADSLEVVHREPPPGHDLPTHAPGVKSTASSSANSNRGGIHAFGRCYIPYTSRGNKELALARSRETNSLLRSLREAEADLSLPPQGVEGEEGMSDDAGAVKAMRAWNPGGGFSAASSVPASHPLPTTDSGHPPPTAGLDNGGGAGWSGTHATATAASQRVGATDGRVKSNLGRMTSPLRGVRDRGLGGVSGAAAAEGGAAATSALNPTPPPLIDVHARLRGSVLSSSPSPATCTLGSGSKPSPGGSGGFVGGKGTQHQQSCPPMGLEPTGVERLGSHYSPAAQALYLDLDRGCLAWRATDRGGCSETVNVSLGGGGGCQGWRGGTMLEAGSESPRAPQRGMAGTSGAAPVWPGIGSISVRALGEGSSSHWDPGASEVAAGGRAEEQEPRKLTLGREEARNTLPRCLGAGGGVDQAAPHEIGHGGEHCPEGEGQGEPLGSPPSPATGKSSDRPVEGRSEASRPIAPGTPRGSARTPRRGHLVGGSLVHNLKGSSSGFEGKGNPAPSCGGAQARSSGRSGAGRDGDRAGAAAVLYAAHAAHASEADRKLQDGYTRYHYYLQRDATLAESVAVLQPPWQAGIVKRVIDGLDRAGAGGASGGLTTSGHNRDRCGGSPGSGSSDGKSGLEDADETATSRPGAAGGARTQKTAAGNGRRSGAGEEDEEGEEGHEGGGEAGDWFEINRSPNSSPVPDAATGKVSESPGAIDGGGAAATGGVRPAPAAAAAAAGGGMPHVPGGLKDGVESCLQETCVAFRTSIRRAVLNYILLDRGQRDRVGIPAVPPGFESEGFGWDSGRGIQRDPPEWRGRFLRAKEAMEWGQITGSPALLAAQELLARCQETRLLRLPASAAEVRSSSWSPMTAEEFRSSQLQHLARRAGRIRRLLWPGLSDALKARLGGQGGDRSGAVGPPPPDGHVRRYLLAVNVMAASVLRGVVEAALSNLLDFFRIHSAVAAAADDERKESGDGDRDPGRGGGGVNGDKKGPSPRHDCPPLFKIFLEDRSKRLTCRDSLRDLKAAVMDVVRSVVMCFADLPRVTYERSDHSIKAAGIGARSAAAGGSAIQKTATPSGAAAGAGADLGDTRSRTNTDAAERTADDGATACRGDMAHSSSGTNRRLSLYLEPDSDSDSSSDRSATGGACTSEDGSSRSSGSDAGSVGPLKAFQRCATEVLTMAAGGGGDVNGGDSGGRSMSRGGAGAANLTVLSPTETAVRDVIQGINSCLRAESSLAKAACRVYRPFEALLEEEAAQALARSGQTEVEVAEQDLPDLASSLQRYKRTAAVLRGVGEAAPVELPGRMIVVDCEATSRKLLSISADLWKGALQRVEMSLAKLASGMTKQARTAILRLSKRPRSTEEMVEAIESLRTTRAEEQLNLRQRQMWMGQLLDFVFRHGGLNQDVVVAVAGVHRVMGELGTAVEKAGKAIAEGKAQLKKNLEKAKRRLQTDVESMQMRIAGFIDSDGRQREMTDNAAGFSKELAELKAQAVSIGEEEAKVDGYTSGGLIALTETVIQSFQPYADVWGLVGAAGPFVAATARTPVSNLDPEAISAEHASMKGRLEALKKTMIARSNEVPARAAQESLRLLGSLEKDIPVIKALTNEHLKDRHWWQVSALVGVTVSYEHPTTLQHLNELDVLTDAKVEAILRLSDDANAEHELEESTADVDRFVNEEAVVRIKIGGDDGGGGDVAGGGNREGAAAAQEGAAGMDGTVGAVSMLDDDHLRGVLEQVKNWQKVVSEVKLTDSARAVAAAAAATAAAAAAATDGGGGQGQEPPTGIIETLETALSNLIRAGEAMLKAAELVGEIESELDETTGDEADREEVLKDALSRWQALLGSSSGRSLKDIVEVVEEEAEHLEEVSEA